MLLLCFQQKLAGEFVLGCFRWSAARLATIRQEKRPAAVLHVLL
ncbi:hypothetical protein [Alkalicoccus daliensis]|uniref:Uncharacterized protein n=1 Tax=Alkalicoccus daliensis TaxID=745820 RepID=A0A1H0ERK7_9BACI|nr:hypothetical protein [Alkalicoccus daliensis]SDN85097.1 hypothetical protein SAMN04488053_10438 [Alkalicoccus daliensis]